MFYAYQDRLSNKIAATGDYGGNHITGVQHPDLSGELLHE